MCVQLQIMTSHIREVPALRFSHLPGSHLPFARGKFSHLISALRRCISFTRSALKLVPSAAFPPPFLSPPPGPQQRGGCPGLPRWVRVQGDLHPEHNPSSLHPVSPDHHRRACALALTFETCPASAPVLPLLRFLVASSAPPASAPRIATVALVALY